jgi:hypothetical protein
LRTSTSAVLGIASSVCLSLLETPDSLLGTASSDRLLGIELPPELPPPRNSHLFGIASPENRNRITSSESLPILPPPPPPNCLVRIASSGSPPRKEPPPRNRLRLLGYHLFQITSPQLLPRSPPLQIASSKFPRPNRLFGFATSEPNRLPGIAFSVAFSGPLRIDSTELRLPNHRLLSEPPESSPRNWLVRITSSESPRPIAVRLLDSTWNLHRIVTPFSCSLTMSLFTILTVVHLFLPRVRILSGSKQSIWL